jgi:alpha-ketoglutarate-dependent taurine dioxygenase
MFPFRVPDSFISSRSGNENEYIRAPILAENDPLIRFRYDSIIEGFSLDSALDHTEASWALGFVRDVINDYRNPVLWLEAGDLLLTNNHEILHGRTSFSSMKRLLVRVRIQ